MLLWNILQNLTWKLIPPKSLRPWQQQTLMSSLFSNRWQEKGSGRGNIRKFEKNRQREREKKKRGKLWEGVEPRLLERRPLLTVVERCCKLRRNNVMERCPQRITNSSCALTVRWPNQKDWKTEKEFFSLEKRYRCKYVSSTTCQKFFHLYFYHQHCEVKLKLNTQVK